MFGLKFTGSAPFRDVYVHGLVRDADGQKMSKSKGNVLDPLDLIDGIALPALVEKRTTGLMQPQMAKHIEDATRRQFPDGIPSFGTDALRFTFASLATQGRDIRFDLGRVEGFRNFCNKLWNAARFVMMNTDSLADKPLANFETGTAERWINSRLQHIAQDVATSMEVYRLDQVVQTLHAFAWDEYCSWYLEIAKIELADDSLSEVRKDGVRQTLVNVLGAALRMIHPIMPFITEALWQQLRSRTLTNSDSIMNQPYPQFEPNQVDDEAVADMEWVQAIVSGVRNIRGEMNIDPRKELPVIFQGGNDLDKRRARDFHTLLAALGRLQSLAFVADDENTPQSAMALSGEMKILVPLGSVIDRAAELKRLEREVEKLAEDLQRCQTKLSNPNFVARAPEDIVTKEKNRADQLARDIEELKSQQTRVASL